MPTPRYKHRAALGFDIESEHDPPLESEVWSALHERLAGVGHDEIVEATLIETERSAPPWGSQSGPGSRWICPNCRNELTEKPNVIQGYTIGICSDCVAEFESEVNAHEN